MNIYQRINAVRKELGYLQKDATVRDGGGYKAITHDKVTDAAREHLITHGVVIVMRQQSGQTLDTGQVTGKGTPWVRYEATYEFDFVNIEDGDKFTVAVAAHAMDTGDKAPGKAASYAKKTALLKTLELVTGEDDEAVHADRRPQEVDEGAIISWQDSIEAASDLTELERMAKDLAKAPKPIKDAVRPLYAARKKQLEAA